MKRRSLTLCAFALTVAISSGLAQNTGESQPSLPAPDQAPAISSAAPANPLPAANPAPPMPEPAVDDWVPETRSERIGAYVSSTFGPLPIAGTVAGAAIGHVRNDPREWGRQPGGFAARLGSGLATHVVRGTLEHGAAALLHEDNRYRRSTAHGFWNRSRHALIASFLARHDNGRYGFGFSKIGSAGGAAFLSRLWMPRSAATLGAGFSSFGITIAADVGVNFLREFWPDLKKKLGGK